MKILIKMNEQHTVIDLTVSFTLADHSSMADTIIELDDSLSSVQTAVRHDGTVETVRRTTPRQNTSSSQGGRQPPLDRKPPKKSKTKVQPRGASNLVRNRSSTRERSPVGMGSCPICLEKIGKNPVASTNCGHIFCVECLERVFSNNKKQCPTCRKALRGKNAYHRLFLNVD